MSVALDVRCARHRRIRREALLLSALALIVFTLWTVAVMCGGTFYGPDTVVRVILGETVPGASFTVGELRLPRATLGLLAGLAFGAAGVTFQTMLRNQLASPDIIGISAGAGAAGVIGIVVLGVSETTVSTMALAAALTTALGIYTLSYRGGFAGTRLILIGVGISSMLGSVVSYTLARASAWDLQTANRWLTGSLNAATWERVAPLALTCAAILPFLWFGAHSLTTLRFGDDTAAGLGVRVRAVRIATILGAVALVAVATASCGPVAFVAFMSGPIALRLSRTAGSPVVSASLVGAILVLGSDLVGQFAFGTRYPVGVITGALGAPFLVYLLVRAHRVRRN